MDKHQCYLRVLGQVIALDTLIRNRLRPTVIGDYLVRHTRYLLTSTTDEGTPQELARMLSANSIAPEVCQFFALALLLESRALMKRDEEGDDWRCRWYRDAESLILQLRQFLLRAMNASKMIADGNEF